MSESVDLRSLLESWPYEPDRNVRIVRGQDGREVLQVRLLLGLEQYELEGRPDGRRPHGRESALDHHLDRLAQARPATETASFGLSAEDCAELFHEGTLYYFRYLHCFQLRQWRRTARDTERNLTMFDFVHRYAERAEDRQHLEKWRPYVLRMNAAARSLLELDHHHHARALEIAGEAMRKISSLDRLEDETFEFEQERSLMALRELVARIQQMQPVSELERLERRLREAVETQEFERAAELRDRIRELRKIAD